jgi:hypothetical protein
LGSQGRFRAAREERIFATRRLPDVAPEQIRGFSATLPRRTETVGFDEYGTVDLAALVSSLAREGKNPRTSAERGSIRLEVDVYKWLP